MTNTKKILLIIAGLAFIGAIAGAVAFGYLKEKYRSCTKDQGDEAVKACATMIRVFSVSDIRPAVMTRTMLTLSQTMALSKQGKHQEAYDNGLVLLELANKLGDAPGITAANGMLGNTAAKLKKYDETVKYTSQALAAGETDAETAMACHFQLGQAYTNLERYPEAVASLEKAISSGLPVPEAAYDLGLAHLRTGDYSKAYLYFMEALPKAGDYPRLNEYLGETNFRLGRYPDAINYLNLALQADPACPDCASFLEEAQAMVKKPARRKAGPRRR